MYCINAIYILCNGNVDLLLVDLLGIVSIEILLVISNKDQKIENHMLGNIKYREMTYENIFSNTYGISLWLYTLWFHNYQVEYQPVRIAKRIENDT